VYRSHRAAFPVTHVDLTPGGAFFNFQFPALGDYLSHYSRSLQVA
jgi:hypothetical protein